MMSHRRFQNFLKIYVRKFKESSISAFQRGKKKIKSKRYSSNRDIMTNNPSLSFYTCQILIFYLDFVISLEWKFHKIGKPLSVPSKKPWKTVTLMPNT